MEKGTFCTDHFVLNCRLCGQESPVLSAPVNKVPDPQVQSIIENHETQFKENQNMVDSLSRAEPSPIQSVEGQKVVSVADEYARACEKYEQAVKQGIDMNAHIDKMREVLIELDRATSEAKKDKDRLKKKVLETLALGGDE